MKKPLLIGFVGNFLVPYSTENDRKWSLQKLGHNVVTFQENQTTQEDLLTWLPKLDLLIYSHTHDPSYYIEGLRDVFRLYKRAGVPTASVHLDRWAWLERVKDVGHEATWFTEYQFMADASPEAVELYSKLELNWFYLKPGVVERDCYMASPDPVRFPHEIAFIGSRGYHPEYPFRAELVDFLKETYGDCFGHYGNDGLGVVRGHDLNVLCASSKLVVGDSCFGGRPNYVSDRYYEIRGRGGVLLHPFIEGVDNEGVWHYERQDLKSLKEAIDEVLSNSSLEIQLRNEGFDHVKDNETYTHRMKEMLEVIFK